MSVYELFFLCVVLADGNGCSQFYSVIVWNNFFCISLKVLCSVPIPPDHTERAEVWRLFAIFIAILNKNLAMMKFCL